MKTREPVGDAALERRPRSQTMTASTPPARTTRGEARTHRDRVRQSLRTVGFDQGREQLRPPERSRIEPSKHTSNGQGPDGFVAQGLMGPMQVRAPTGIGGFDVSYSPAAEVELVRIGGGVAFKDGITLNGGLAHTVISKLEPEVDRLNRLPTSFRNEDLRPYQWTDAEKAAWLKRLEAAVEGFWSGQFQFHATRPGWEALGARAALDVDVREGPKQADDHLALEVHKVPDDVSAGIGVLRPGKDALDNRMILGSSDVAPRNDSMLEESLAFAPGGTTLANPATLDMLAVRFKAGSTTPPKVRLQVQGEGKDPEAMAKRRFARLRDQLVALGIAKERLEFVDGGTGSAAHCIVGDGGAQNIAVHEFGHALGLKDEYAQDPGGQVSGSGKPAGTPSGHDAMARQVGLPGSVHENHDGLMSFGNLMRPQYAAPFLWGLRQVTRMPDWAEGPPRKAGETAAKDADASGPGEAG